MRWSGFPWLHDGLRRGVCSRTLLISVLIAAVVSALPTPRAAAELNRDIDLVRESGLRNVTQRAFLWAHLAIGPNQDLKMWQCGCLLAVLSTLFKYEVGSAGLPWFPTHFFPFGVPVTLLDFNPHYLDLFFNFGPNEEGDAGWGYKLRPGCGVMPKPFAVATAASSAGMPAGFILEPHPGLRTSSSRDIVDRNLLNRRPTIVIRRMTPEEVRWMTGVDGPAGLHAQLVVGWDNQEKKYLIVDPLLDAGALPTIPTTLQGTYEDWQSSTVHILETRLSFGEQGVWLIFGDDPSPIEIQMVNPAGRRTGFDPVTQENFREDFSASYWNLDGWVDPLGQRPLGDPVKFVVVQNPVEGTYRFQVIGTGDGPFSISSSVVAGATETVLQTVTDTITKNEVRKFAFRFSLTEASAVSEVENFAPEAKVSNDVKGLTDMPIQVDGRRSFDVDGSIVSYTWDFGDGTTDTGAQVSHVYTTSGVYTVELTVMDDGGATATATLQASILLSQRRPAAHASGPYLGFAAAAHFPAFIDFNGSKSSDPNGDPLTFQWNLGDGSPLVVDTSPFVRHTYTTPGTYTVTLIVNDGIEDSEPVTTTVEVLPPPEAQQPQVSVLPSCGPAGAPIAFQVEPFTLMSFGGAQTNVGYWDFGAEGPLPPIPKRISLGIPGTPDGQVLLRVLGPIDSFDEFLPWTAALSSPVQYSLRIPWTIPTSWEPGVYQLTLGEESSTSFQVPCLEPDNHPPLAHAGGPTYVGNAGTSITFDGSLSSDPDGDPLTYLWHFGDGNMGSGVNPQHTYAEAGEYAVTLIVSDGQDLSFPTVGTRSFAEALVGAGSNRPVMCNTAKPSVGVLWPPNHKFVPLRITEVTDPDNDPVTITITRVTQDEPVNGLGDGETSPDAMGVGTSVVKVRAERSGTGDGRVYHIDFTADDGKGGVCTSKITVCAPHDRGKDNTCGDHGRLFDSTVSQ
jgi:PKD repeat protein